MAKAIKYSLFALLTFILLVVIGVGLLIAFVNPNDFKGPISKQVYHITGRKLTINGNISWSFFPWLSLNVYQLNVSNPRGFSQKDFASLKEADVNIRLLPLLIGKFEIGKILLKDLSVQLLKKKNGTSNWHDLIKKDNTEKAKADTSLNTDNKNVKLAPLALTISAIDLDNAHITYHDQQNNTDISIKQLNLSSNNIGFNKDFPIHLSGKLRDNETKIASDFNINSKINLDTEQQIIYLRYVEIVNQTMHPHFKQGKIILTAKMRGNLNLKQRHLTLSELKGQLANLRITAKLTGSKLFIAPVLQGNIVVHDFNPKLLLNALGMDSIALKNPNVLQSAQVKGHFSLSKQHIALTKLQAKLDHTNMRGEFVVDRPSTQPAVQFNLAIGDINVDDYRTQTNNARAKARAKQDNKAAAQGTSIQWPMPLLRRLKLEGQMTIKKLIATSVQLNNVKAKFHAIKGIFSISPMTAQLYGGSYKGQVTMNAHGQAPRYNLIGSLTDVQIAPILHPYLANKNLAVSGTATMSTDLSSAGNNSQQIIRNLSGHIKFALQNGVLQGIDLMHQLQIATALFKKQNAPQQSGNDETRFVNLSGTINISKGIATNNDLNMDTSLLRVKGRGTANLNNERINYLLNLSTQPKVTNSTILELQKILGGSVPIKITGTFSKRQIYPDATAIAKGTAKYYLTKQTSKLTEQLNKQTGGLVGKAIQQGLGGLFGQ